MYQLLDKTHEERFRIYLNWFFISQSLRRDPLCIRRMEIEHRVGGFISLFNLWVVQQKNLFDSKMGQKLE